MRVRQVHYYKVLKRDKLIGVGRATGFLPTQVECSVQKVTVAEILNILVEKASYTEKQVLATLSKDFYYELGVGLHE